MEGDASRRDYFTHRFEGLIEQRPLGRYAYVVVYLPEALAAGLPLREHPRLRIEADVGGVPVKGAWQPGGGRWYLMLSKSARRAGGFRLGDPVEVAFRVVAQDAIDLPPELAAAVAGPAKRRRAWGALSAGTRRALAFYVDGVKGAGARAARLATAIDVIEGRVPPPWKYARRPKPILRGKARAGTRRRAPAKRR